VKKRRSEGKLEAKELKVSVAVSVSVSVSRIIQRLHYHVTTTCLHIRLGFRV
jgi:hypothetical protein